MQGIKLYYHVLEAMLKGEEAQGRKSFTSLLESDSFHMCLIACAFEMVIASYRMVRRGLHLSCARVQCRNCPCHR